MAVLLVVIMIIAGVDPGKATGLSVWCLYCGLEHLNPRNAPSTAEVESSNAVGAVLRRMIGEHDASTRGIAVERFVQGSRKTRQPDALEATGQVGALAAELGIKIVYQNPGPALKIASNQLLRELGWYVPSRDQHANAASRHVLLYMATFFPETFARLTGR